MKKIIEVWKQPENCFECEMFEKFKFIDGISKLEIPGGGYGSKNRLKSANLVVEEWTGLIGRCGVFGRSLKKEMCDEKLVNTDVWNVKHICEYKYK